MVAGVLFLAFSYAIPSITREVAVSGLASALNPIRVFKHTFNTEYLKILGYLILLNILAQVVILVLVMTFVGILLYPAVLFLMQVGFGYIIGVGFSRVKE